jgi:hypothetical protein
LREYLCHIGPSALKQFERIAKGELHSDVVWGRKLPVEFLIRYVIDVALMQ